jgi:hypothetical protein
VHLKISSWKDGGDASAIEVDTWWEKWGQNYRKCGASRLRDPGLGVEVVLDPEGGQDAKIEHNKADIERDRQICLKIPAAHDHDTVKQTPIKEKEGEDLP